jgi:heme oxygenase-like protein
MPSGDTLRNSARLDAKLRLVRPSLESVAAMIWEHPRAERIYPEYLAALHGVVRASVPLMRAASQRSRELAGDGVAAGMIAYLERHIEEECEHDSWLLEDLEALGVPRSNVLARMPADSTARAVGAQYYWIEHVHPVSLLGYIGVLEGQPPRIEFLDGVAASTGLPIAAFRTLYKHASVDVQHGCDLRRLLDELPLEQAHESLIGVSVINTVAELAETLRRVLRSAA